MDSQETIDVLRYEGGNDVLVWKHPKVDFNTGTQLIVHESQEAILYLNGQALDLFGPGRHTLQTQNVPVFSRFMKRPLGDQTPFHCEVYFVNRVTLLDILWGTASPIPIQDPKYEIILPVRANGQFGLRVENSRKLLVKLVGTTAKFDRETLTALFRGILMTNIKDYISRMMVERQISFLEVHGHITEASGAIRALLVPLFDEYGFAVVNFNVNSISVPEDDPRLRAHPQRAGGCQGARASGPGQARGDGYRRLHLSAAAHLRGAGQGGLKRGRRRHHHGRGNGGRHGVWRRRDRRRGDVRSDAERDPRSRGGSRVPKLQSLPAGGRAVLPRLRRQDCTRRGLRLPKMRTADGKGQLLS